MSAYPGQFTPMVSVMSFCALGSFPPVGEIAIYASFRNLPHPKAIVGINQGCAVFVNNYLNSIDKRVRKPYQQE